MDRLRKYNLSKEDIDFVILLKNLCEGGTPFDLDCDGYTFQVDPGGDGVELWKKEKVGDFDSLLDMLENFKVNGKTLIEQIDVLGFEDE